MNTAPMIPDIRGYPRPKDGDGNGTATVDMGAYEFWRSTIVAKKALMDCLANTLTIGEGQQVSLTSMT